MEAIKRLASSGYTFKVVLVGDGYLRPELEALIAEWKLEDFVELTGWASGAVVRQKILESRALVLPSFAEGLPVVIMEALALNRPVISTCIAGIPELLGNDICGWLIPSGSIDSLTQTMAKVMNTSTEVLAVMGQAGAERVAKEHDAAVEAQKLVKLFCNSFDATMGTLRSEDMPVAVVSLVSDVSAIQNS